MQAFSSSVIDLDLLPEHPTEIIRELVFELEGEMQKNFNLLHLVNILNKHIKFRFDGDYKIIPMPTKKERQKYLEARKHLALMVYGKHFDNTLLQNKEFMSQLWKDHKRMEQNIDLSAFSVKEEIR